MKTPILIIGYERSGTTLLRRLVSMHPALDYELIHERPQLLFKCSTPKDAIKLMQYDGTQAGRKTGSIMSVRSGQKIPYLSFKKAKETTCKFRDLFPQSRIIHIIRDPIYAINSQVKTFKKNAAACVDKYFNAVPKIVKWLKTIDNVKFVQFEDMIENPQNFVENLYEWMGDSVSPDHIKKVLSMRDPWKCGNRIMPGLRYFDSISKQQPTMVLPKNIVKVIKERKSAYNL